MFEILFCLSVFWFGEDVSHGIRSWTLDSNRSGSETQLFYLMRAVRKVCRLAMTHRSTDGWLLSGQPSSVWSRVVKCRVSSLWRLQLTWEIQTYTCMTNTVMFLFTVKYSCIVYNIKITKEHIFIYSSINRKLSVNLNICVCTYKLPYFFKIKLFYC